MGDRPALAKRQPVGHTLLHCCKIRPSGGASNHRQLRVLCTRMIAGTDSVNHPPTVYSETVNVCNGCRDPRPNTRGMMLQPQPNDCLAWVGLGTRYHVSSLQYTSVYDVRRPPPPVCPLASVVACYCKFSSDQNSPFRQKEKKTMCEDRRPHHKAKK